MIPRITQILADHPEKVDRFLSYAALPPADPDRFDMTQMICSGITPYSAARSRADSGESKKHFSTLHYHARNIFSELCLFVFGDPRDILAELLGGAASVYSPISQMNDILKAAEDNGTKIKVDVRYRLDDEES